MNIAPKPCPFCGETRTRLMTTNTAATKAGDLLDRMADVLRTAKKHIGFGTDPRTPQAKAYWAADEMLAEYDAFRSRATPSAESDQSKAGDLREAVLLARNIFEGYAALHREKGTQEGDAKAAFNTDLAARMNIALSAAPAPKSKSQAKRLSALAGDPASAAEGARRVWCATCGRQNPRGSVECAYCGIRFARMASDPAQSANMPSEAVAQIEWRQGTDIPRIAERSDQAFIVCVQRAHNDKRYVFEPGDDLAWCEKRAAEVLPIVRKAIAGASGQPARGEISEAEVVAACAAFDPIGHKALEGDSRCDYRANMRAALEAAARVRGGG
jgi:hypothetical protein